MTEPETQTEDETVTSDFLEEVKKDTTDTDVTEDATSDQVSTKYKSTDYESETNEDTRKRPWMDEG